MKKKLLVTGYGGFVAGSIIAQAKDEWEVHAAGRRDVFDKQGNVNYYKLDLLESDKLLQLFHDINPDAVIHAAAMADIDFCENNQNIAEKVNVGITRTLAGLCKEHGAKMVFCSTDSIFDGKKGMYTEDDTPKPINYYAETKVNAEEIVRATGNGVAARLSLVMGMPVMGSGNSFLAKTIKLLQAGESIKFPSNETRTPVDVITLGRSLVELAGNDFMGTMHLSGNTRITRYEMAKQITGKLGYSEDLIVAIDSNAMEGRAPRPNDASLDNRLAKKILKTPMRSLIEGLELTMNFKTK